MFVDCPMDGSEVVLTPMRMTNTPISSGVCTADDCEGKLTPTTTTNTPINTPMNSRDFKEMGQQNGEYAR